MAFVTLNRWLGKGTPVKTGTAQADTGQTTWISVPPWAQRALVELNMTATAGATPGPTLMHVRTVAPNLAAVGTANAGKLDDTNAVTLQTATVGLANTGLYRVAIGPTVAPADVSNTADNKLNAVLPDILGIQVVLDRTDGSETYTYTLSVDFVR
jgi:hypothetical protein